ncbi:MAG TPA: hypothetical protein VFQ53_41800 [Kofleriaceae bacterium]|nr:hypothetical protein [Kofleriaceae bacterium]
MRSALAILVVVAACTTPPLTIYYQPANGGPQSCNASTCDQVPMPCDSILSLRVLDPDHPETPYISICEPITPAKDLCSISKINLPIVEMPRKTLEVQMTIWPASSIPIDDATGELNCLNTPVTFDAVDGFPVGAGGPALGGRAFYHPGDDETVVTLGCTDLQLVNAPTCAGTNTVPVTARVRDFELLPFSVSSADADQLNVFIGKPVLLDTEFELNPAQSRALDRVPGVVPPQWSADVDLMFDSSACVQVLEDAPQSTTVVTCETLSPPITSVDIAGVRVTRESLQQLLTALGLAAFPEAGMTIGIVLDNNLKPAQGYTVTSTQGTVQYLNGTRTGLATGTKTTASGMFVSLDAPYGTFFDAALTVPLGQQIGGRLLGKLTFIVFEQPSIGN